MLKRMEEIMDEKNQCPVKDKDCGIAASKLLKKNCKKKSWHQQLQK